MRTVDYSVSDIGPVVYLDGNDNYKVLDNDLLGTSTLIGTGSNQPGASFLGGGDASARAATGFGRLGSQPSRPARAGTTP